jgi:hypothetical protein
MGLKGDGIAVWAQCAELIWMGERNRQMVRRNLSPTRYAPRTKAEGVEARGLKCICWAMLDRPLLRPDQDGALSCGMRL